MSYLAIVPALHVEDIWFRVLPHLLNGKEHWEKFYSTQQIRKNLVLGRQQLWIMVEGTEVIGVVLTQLDEFPEVKSLRILFLGGKGFKRKMIKQMERIEIWAKDHGATVADFLGREEWEPLVKSMGYSSPGRIYRKDLTS